jgi:hypothetical protein
MRPRGTTQAPSTDEKRVKRQMQRKTAVSGPDCGSCGCPPQHHDYSSDSNKSVEYGKTGECRGKGGRCDCKAYKKPISLSGAKVADLRGPAGECRLCGGDLHPTGHSGETMQEKCRDCGTEHELQSANGRTAAQQFEAFQNLSDAERERIERLAWLDPAFRGSSCSHCGASSKHLDFTGAWSTSSNGQAASGHDAVCRKCGSHTRLTLDDKPPYAATAPGSYARTASSHTAALLPFVGSTWEPNFHQDLTVAMYVGDANPGNAIARRARDVLAFSEETL